MQRSIPFAQVANQSLPAAPIQLGGQQVAIKNILVDNTNASVPVWIYQGTSPIGTPLIVPAFTFRSLPIDGTAALYVVFPTTPLYAGMCYIIVSDEPAPAADAPGIIATTPFPFNASPFAYSAVGPFGSSFQIGADLGPPNIKVGQKIYLTYFLVKGFSNQRTLWTAQFIDADNVTVLGPVVVWEGDLVASFNPPIPSLSASSHAGQWNILIQQTVLTDIIVGANDYIICVNVGGYIL